MHFHKIFLQVQRFQVMGHRHQIRFRRQFIGGVIPVTVLERAQLTGLHKLADAGLDIAEITRAGHGVGRGYHLLQLGRCLGIGFQCIHRIHPVQRMQVIEMHHVIVHLQGLGHDFPDQVGIGGDFNAQGIFHGTHRR